jgi:hypothetical protein
MYPIARHHSLSAIDRSPASSQAARPASPVETRESASRTIFVHCTPSSSNITVLHFMREANLVSALTRRSSLQSEVNPPSSGPRLAVTLPAMQHRARLSCEGLRTHSEIVFQLNDLVDLPGRMADKESMRTPEPSQTIASSSHRKRASSFGMDPWAIPARIHPLDMPSTPVQIACNQATPAAASQKVSRQMLKDGIRSGLPAHEIQDLLAHIAQGPSRWQSVSADRQWRTRRLMDAIHFLNPSDVTTLAPFARSLGISEKELRSCIKNMMRGHWADTGFSVNAISEMLGVLHTNYPTARATSDYVRWGVRRQAEIDARFNAREADLLCKALENLD